MNKKIKQKILKEIPEIELDNEGIIHYSGTVDKLIRKAISLTEAEMLKKFVGYLDILKLKVCLDKKWCGTKDGINPQCKNCKECEALKKQLKKEISDD